MKSRKTPQQRPAGTSPVPPRAAKTPKGQRVMKRVLAAARTLLQSRVARSVTVAEIAKSARLPRASVLLQFPDGLPDIAERLIYEEYLMMFECDEMVDLVSAATQQEQQRRLTPGLESALLPLVRLVEKAPADGFLHANLMSEALLFEGSRLLEHRARLGILGLVLTGRICDPQQRVSMRNIGFGEMLGRIAWDLAANRWEPATFPGFGRVDYLRAIAKSLVPNISAPPRVSPQ